jgi:hypothetical protein
MFYQFVSTNIPHFHYFEPSGAFLSLNYGCRERAIDRGVIEFELNLVVDEKIYTGLGNVFFWYRLKYFHHIYAT